MGDVTWWMSQLVNWIPFIILIFVWIFLSRTSARRGPFGLNAQIVEMKRTNELLERIAVALEKRAPPGA